MQRYFMIVLACSFILTIAASCDAATPIDSHSSPLVSGLLLQARMSHEPTGVIVRAVELLDRNLDQNPLDRHAWLQLGEALAIGNARSRHAQTASLAWRQAYLLNKADCHAGALATPWADVDERDKWVRQLKLDHVRCPEAIYLSALVSNDVGERIALLQSSIALQRSSDALLTLAQDMILAKNLQEAMNLYLAALSSPPLFPEDWRPDGRTAVHAHLGLAWGYYLRGQLRSARREFQIFLGWFNEPGPWHDLSEQEERWHTKLSAKFSVNLRQ